MSFILLHLRRISGRRLYAWLTSWIQILLRKRYWDFKRRIHCFAFWRIQILLRKRYWDLSVFGIMTHTLYWIQILLRKRYWDSFAISVMTYCSWNSNSTAEAVLRQIAWSFSSEVPPNSNSTAEAVLRHFNVCHKHKCFCEFKFYCGSGIETYYFNIKIILFI